MSDESNPPPDAAMPETHRLRVVPTGEPHLHWKKPGSPFARERVTGWSLNLDLLTSNNRRSGSMTLYRNYGGRDLRLDANLLISAFPVSLADALDRALSQGLEVVPVAKEDTGMRVAKAV